MKNIKLPLTVFIGCMIIFISGHGISWAATIYLDLDSYYSYATVGVEVNSESGYDVYSDSGLDYAYAEAAVDGVSANGIRYSDTIINNNSLTDDESYSIAAVLLYGTHSATAVGGSAGGGGDISQIFNLVVTPDFGGLGTIEADIMVNFNNADFDGDAWFYIVDTSTYDTIFEWNEESGSEILDNIPLTFGQQYIIDSYLGFGFDVYNENISMSYIPSLEIRIIESTAIPIPSSLLLLVSAICSAFGFRKKVQ